jgi:hypothetical protein
MCNEVCFRFTIHSVNLSNKPSATGYHSKKINFSRKNLCFPSQDGRQHLATVVVREDVEVHLHALQSMTEQFQLCEWGTVMLENCIIVQK